MESGKLGIKRPRGRPMGQSDWLTIDELQAMIKLPDRREKSGKRDYAVLLVFANTAMRIGEVISLTVGNLVDEGKKKFITYKALKKRKIRNKVTGEVKIKQTPVWIKVPIAHVVYEGIKQYILSENKGKALAHGAPMFMTLGIRGPYEKCALTIKAATLIVKKYARKAGINKRITPHTFRATFTTNRLAEGHDIRSVQAIGGWASIQSVQPYAREVAEKIEAAALAHVVA